MVKKAMRVMALAMAEEPISADRLFSLRSYLM
jgi:hypothetical protein